MAHGFSDGDPFHPLEAVDGFHAVCVRTAHTLTISCVAYGGGIPLNLTSDDPTRSAAVVLRLDDPTPEQVGAAQRLHLALSAVAMYLTTGGNWGEFADALRTFRGFAAGGLVFPGYHLVTSYLTTENRFQHVFARDGTEEAVLWESPDVGDSGVPVGGWIESTTLTKIREQQEDDQFEWQGEKEAGRRPEAEGTAALLRSPGPVDPRPS